MRADHQRRRGRRWVITVVTATAALVVAAIALSHYLESSRIRVLLPGERARLEAANAAMRIRIASQLTAFREAIRVGIQDRRLLPVCGPDSGGHDPGWTPLIVRIPIAEISEVTPADYRVRGTTPGDLDRRLADARGPLRADRVEPSLHWFEVTPAPLSDQAVFVVTDSVDPTVNTMGVATSGMLSGTVFLFDALAQRCVCASSLTVTNSAEMRARMGRGTTSGALHRDLDARVTPEILAVFERRIPN